MPVRRLSVYGVQNDPDDSTSLKGNLVRVIYEDSKGQLYIGTENGGLNKFDRDKETFQHIFYNGDSPLLKDVSVTSIMEDHVGNLWVGTETNLYRIEKVNRLTTIIPANLQVFSEYFRVIRSDYSAKIWIGTNIARKLPPIIKACKTMCKSYHK